MLLMVALLKFIACRLARIDQKNVLELIKALQTQWLNNGVELMTPADLAKSGSEHAEQRALLAWSNQAARFGVWFANHPEAYKDQIWRSQWMERCRTADLAVYDLEWLHAIHNQGHGDQIRGGKAKAEGVKPGVADLFLPVPRPFIENGCLVGVYHGLYMEMKPLKSGKPSDEQELFRDYVVARGYRWLCCHGWKQGRDSLATYLGLTLPPDAL